jgi:hypothetical protein
MTTRKYIFMLASLFAINIYTGETNAAEKTKNYNKPPFGAFSSQMQDALVTESKYAKPVWNLHDALKLPEWLALTIDQRARYETMDGTFRANTRGGDQEVPLQTTLWIQAQLGAFRFGGEFMDARVFSADKGTGVSNTQINEADFLQGYIAWADQNVGNSGLGMEVIAGRQTLNFGSYRLVARNVYRNTINSFTGVRLRLLDYKNWQFNGFVTMPVIRYPTAATELLNDVHQFDKEDTNTLFSGGILEVNNLGWGINSEAYLYHLYEGDSIGNQTRNRRFFIPGMRFYSKPGKSKFDFQLETMGQFGTVRATNAITDGRDLQHTAWSQHADMGYTFNMPWSPRIGVDYNYASGDSNPNDGTDQRFDPMYGESGFDFGPTGIYTAFLRTNINSPGYVISASPHADVKTTFKHRAFWLASASDSLANTGLQDKIGHSGDFVGHQLELTTRWDVNSSLSLETGWTHLFKGQFAKQAPSAPNPQDVDYFFVQSMLRF